MDKNIFVDKWSTVAKFSKETHLFDRGVFILKPKRINTCLKTLETDRLFFFQAEKKMERYNSYFFSPAKVFPKGYSYIRTLGQCAYIYMLYVYMCIYAVSVCIYTLYVYLYTALKCLFSSEENYVNLEHNTWVEHFTFSFRSFRFISAWLTLFSEKEMILFHQGCCSMLSANSRVTSDPVHPISK